MTKLRSFISTAAAVAGLFTATSAFAAEYIAYDVAAATAGTQNFTGALGMDFDVVAPINVYSLGVLDSGQDGLAVPLVARIYDRDNTAAPLVTINFAAGMTGTLVNGSRYLPLPCPTRVRARASPTSRAFCRTRRSRPS